MANSRQVSAPAVSEDAVMLIIEKLVELRKEYYSRCNDADDNGMYHSKPSDQTILEDVNIVLKWVASGGLG